MLSHYINSPWYYSTTLLMNATGPNLDRSDWLKYAAQGGVATLLSPGYSYWSRENIHDIHKNKT